MWQFIKYIFVSIFTVCITLIIVNSNNLYTRPDSPPRLYRSLFINTPPTKEEVKHYQDKLLDYIAYLEQYFVSVGLYYDGRKELPILLHRNDGCRLFEYTFKQISLPAPPIQQDDTDYEIIVSKLAEQVVQLRGRIKEHNAYTAGLAKYYRPCYDPNYEPQ